MSEGTLAMYFYPQTWDPESNVKYPLWTNDIRMIYTIYTTYYALFINMSTCKAALYPKAGTFISII